MLKEEDIKVIGPVKVEFYERKTTSETWRVVKK